MDDDLKQNLLHTLFRMKKITLTLASGRALAPGQRVKFSELFLMRSLSERETSSEKQCAITEAQRFLFVSKAAMSQMIASLEDKGYVRRDIDPSNRRKIVVTLTSDGTDYVRDAERKFDASLAATVERMGEADVRELIRLINRFTDTANAVNGEI